MKPHSLGNQAFTLIELLVVIAMVGLLVATALPGFARTRERNKRIGCLNNLRQMGAGSQMFAQDSDSGNAADLWQPPNQPKGILTGSVQYFSSQAASSGTDTGTQLDVADDDLNWLYGINGQNPPGKGYVPNLQSFICPSTRNTIRNDNFGSIAPTWYHNGLQPIQLLTDLKQAASSNRATTGGHSYEVFGWWHEYDLRPSGIPRKTLRSVLTHVNHNGYAPGVTPGPARIHLIEDQLHEHIAGGQYGAGNNEDTPNPWDGHGLEGANVVFCDGHAAFVPLANWYDSYQTSEDNSYMNFGMPGPDRN